MDMHSGVPSSLLEFEYGMSVWYLCTEGHVRCVSGIYAMCNMFGMCGMFVGISYCNLTLCSAMYVAVMPFDATKRDTIQCNVLSYHVK